MESELSSEKPQQTPSSVEWREQPFERIERKIAIVKDLWQKASSLPIPSRRDSEKTVLGERKKLQIVYQGALKMFPEAADSLSRYKLLEEQATESADIEEESAVELGSLGQDEDVQFLLRIENGIEMALQKRKTIRSALNRLGARVSLESWRQLMPDVHADIRDAIKKVIVGRFSINVMVDDLLFRSYMHKIGRQEYEDNSGYHIRDSIWNWIKDLGGYERIFSKISMPQETRYFAELREELPEILSHEDFHSFADGFSVRRNFSAALKRLRYRTQRLDKAKSKSSPDIKFSRRLVRDSLMDLIDSNHGELLAELASLPHRDIPCRTFAVIIKEAKEELKRLKVRDEEIDRTIAHMHQTLFNLDWWRSTINKLYQTVQEKAPEKLQDLDLAFAVFPPSKIRHIESLVERWTKSKGK